MTRAPVEVAAEGIKGEEPNLPFVVAVDLATAALTALEREGFVVSNAAALNASRNNLREAWSALAMIREAVETLGPVGAMPSSEHLEGPTFMHEAEAIVAGIRLLASSPKAGGEG